MTMTTSEIGKIVMDAGKSETVGTRRLERMIIRRETDKAILVGFPGSSFETWIPKSKMSEIRRWKGHSKSTGKDYAMLDCTVPAWLATEKMI